MEEKPWGSTPRTVLANTGIEVTKANVAHAASMVEIYAGLVGRSTKMWSMVQCQWLARAVDWQAAFIASQPDLFSSGIYKELEVDDVEVTFVERGMVDLDRRAVRCLLNIGGQGRVRSLRTRGATGLTAGPPRISHDEDTEPDADRDWQQIGTGA